MPQVFKIGKRERTVRTVLFFRWLEGEMFLDRLKICLYTINEGIVLFVAA